MKLGCQMLLRLLSLLVLPTVTAGAWTLSFAFPNELGRSEKMQYSAVGHENGALFFYSHTRRTLWKMLGSLDHANDLIRYGDGRVLSGEPSPGPAPLPRMMPNWQHQDRRAVPHRLHQRWGFAVGWGEGSRTVSYGMLSVGATRVLQLPYWFLFLLACAPLMLPTINAVHRARRLTRCLCPTCAYDLRASSRRCPECGFVRVKPIPQL
jgi:hypothetical protein